MKNINKPKNHYTVVKITDIFKFLCDEISVDIDELDINSNIAKDLSIDGDDFFELMEAFSNLFDVDLSKYL